MILMEGGGEVSKSDVKKEILKTASPKVNFIQCQSFQNKSLNFPSYSDFLLLKLLQFSGGTRDAFELISKH